MTRRIVALWLGLVGLAVDPVDAHHSFASMFDAKKPFIMTGTVTTIAWASPHAHFFIDVVDERTQTTVNWSMEMGSPSALRRAGWTRDTLTVGRQVTVQGTLARDGRLIGNAFFVTFTDTGKRMFAASSQAALLVQGQDDRAR